MSPSTYFSHLRSLTRDSEPRLLRLAVLILAASLCDLVAVGFVGRFLAALSSSELRSVRVSGVIVIAAFATRIALSFLAQLAMTRFALEHQTRLRARLVGTYLHLSWEGRLRKDSSTMIQSILELTAAFAEQVLLGWLKLVNECLVATLLICFLAVTEPVAAATLAALLGLVAITYLTAVRRIMAVVGAENLTAARNVLDGVRQGIGALKEVRVFGGEERFQARVEAEARRYADGVGRYRVLALLPRYLLEAALVVFVVLLVAFGVDRFGSALGMLPTIGVFAAAGGRLLPSMSSITSTLAGIRMSVPTVEQLAHELQGTPPKRHRRHEPSPFSALAFRGVGYRYPSASTAALTAIDLEIHSGEAVGIVGPSGAGKTTLVEILLGFLTPTTGTMTVNERPIADDLRGWLDLVAYIPQSPFLLDDTLAANIAFAEASESVDSRRLDEAVRSAQLEALVARLPGGLAARIGESGLFLSGGERQRVALARAFYHRREVLILDEATSALDDATEREIVEAIETLKGRITLVVIAHRSSLVKSCNRIVRLAEGRIESDQRA